MLISETFRNLRKGRTLKDITHQAGVSIGFWSDVERGRAFPSITTLKKIAENLGLGLSIDFTDKAMVRTDVQLDGISTPLDAPIEKPKTITITYRYE